MNCLADRSLLRFACARHSKTHHSVCASSLEVRTRSASCSAASFPASTSYTPLSHRTIDVASPKRAVSLTHARRPIVACRVGASIGAAVVHSSPWAVWAGLILAACVGLWSEKTKVGRELSGALVATLVGMFMANTGLLPAGAPELDIVYKYLLPLAIPMLLMSADLKRILAETGRILAAFLLGSFCTVAGSLLAYYIIPLGPHFGVDGWKIAAALTARHIGGAVNYMAVADSNHLSASVFGAGLAADDLILTIYFTSIFSLAKSILSDKEKASLENKVPLLDEVAQPSTSKSLILEAGAAPSAAAFSGAAPSDAAASGAAFSGAAPSDAAAPSVTTPSNAAAPSGAAPNAETSQPTLIPEAGTAPNAAPSGAAQNAASSAAQNAASSTETPKTTGGHSTSAYKPIMVLEGITALALSAMICHISSIASKAWGIQGHTITLITALTVILATAVPKLMNPIVPSAQGMARILMQIFCAAIGASANVELVVRTAPILFLFSAVALTGHVVLILGLGKLLGFTRQEILLASNANIGGPSTVAGLATAKGWTTLMVPSILVSTLGYAIGTFVGMFVGHVGLSKMG